MKKEKTLLQQANALFKAACLAIEKSIDKHNGSITIPCEEAFEITIQSCCNGVYPVRLAHLSDEGLTGVEENAAYNPDYDFEEDEDGIVACYGMDYSDIAQNDVCRVADYLCQSNNYAERYDQLLSKAEELIAKIPDGFLVELNGCKSNYIDANADFIFCEFIAAGRMYALTGRGEKTKWSQFMSDDYLTIVDAISFHLDHRLLP